MLSPLQKENLLKRESLTPKERAQNDYNVTRNLVKWLEDLEEVKLVMEHLPERNLKRIVAPEYVKSLFEVSETLLKLLDFHTFYGEISDPDSWVMVWRDENWQPQTRTVKMEDIRLGMLVARHTRALNERIGNSPLDLLFRIVDGKRLHGMPVPPAYPKLDELVKEIIMEDQGWCPL